MFSSLLFGLVVHIYLTSSLTSAIEILVKRPLVVLFMFWCGAHFFCCFGLDSDE